MTIDQILRAVEQLSPDEQAQLIQQLHAQLHGNPLSAAEKMEMLRKAQLDAPIAVEPSISRADWYGDDGR